jgi:hypothetical protein
MNALGQLPGALWQVAVGFSGDTRPLRILGTYRSVSAARNVRIAAIPLLNGRRAWLFFSTKDLNLLLYRPPPSRTNLTPE